MLSVEGAAQQSGELTIRRSPLLELRTESTERRIARRWRCAAAADRNADSDESPLGHRAVPSLSLRHDAVHDQVVGAAGGAARLGRIADRAARFPSGSGLWKAASACSVDERPIYRLRIALPEDLRLDRVNAPEPFQWVVGQEGKRRMLNLYFAAGQRQPFDIVLAGALGKYGEVETIAAPKLEVVDADEQKGHDRAIGRHRRRGRSVARCPRRKARPLRDGVARAASTPG